MESSLKVDLLVIGWGKAGKTLAKQYAATGKSVALVERDPQMYGGTCINVACVPTKDLVVSAEARRPSDDPHEHFTQAVSGRDTLIEKLRQPTTGCSRGWPRCWTAPPASPGPRIAVGDLNGGPQFTYISLDDNRIVWDQLVGECNRRTGDRVGVPTTTFITPPLAQVGLSPDEAREAGHSVLYAAKEVAKIAAMPRPKILGEASGVITVTVDADTRKVLGATLFCVDAQELVNLMALAIRTGSTADDLLNGIWTHPSSTEALNEVLAELEPYDG